MSSKKTNKNKSRPLNDVTQIDNTEPVNVIEESNIDPVEPIIEEVIEPEESIEPELQIDETTVVEESNEEMITDTTVPEPIIEEPIIEEIIEPEESIVVESNDVIVDDNIPDLVELEQDRLNKLKTPSSLNIKTIKDEIVTFNDRCKCDIKTKFRANKTSNKTFSDMTMSITTILKTITTNKYVEIIILEDEGMKKIHDALSGKCYVNKDRIFTENEKVEMYNSLLNSKNKYYERYPKH